MRRRHVLPALEALVDRGLLTTEQASDAMSLSAQTGATINDILSDVVPSLGPVIGLSYPYVDLSAADVQVEAVDLVPEGLARRHGVLPLGFDNERLVVALSDPTNVIALDDLRTVTGRELRTRSMDVRRECVQPVEVETTR